MNKSLIEEFIRKGTDWLFRIRSPERVLIASALGLIVAIYAGLPFIIELLRLFIGVVPEGILGTQQHFVDAWIITIASVMIVTAVGIIIVRFIHDIRQRSKERILVVEVRSLRDDDGTSLEGAAVKYFKGHVISVLLDLRNRMDGKVIKPVQAIEEIYTTYKSMLQHKKQISRNELTVVYGGLASVPYTFLTGLLFDDEGDVKIFDWDRTLEKWRILDDEDDGKAFEVEGIENIHDAIEVVIALGFSYPISDVHLNSTFTQPIVRLTLDGMSSDAHWSMKKQNRLAQQFLEVVKHLSTLGVERIHLVMAAPNSVVFSFGRRYDKRNLPKLSVYQFERDNNPAYPWGVVMPVAGIKSAEIEYTVTKSG